MWQSQLLLQLRQRRQHEVEPFDVIKAYVESRKRYEKLSEDASKVSQDRDRLQEKTRQQEVDLAELRLAAQGLAAHSAKEKELAERLVATEKQLKDANERCNRLFNIESEKRVLQGKLDELQRVHEEATGTVSQLTASLAEQMSAMAVLKREYDALQTENTMQRQQFAKEKAENEKLVPVVLEAKRVEAELRNEIFELEQKLLNKGSPQTPHQAGTSDVLFSDRGVMPQSTCVAPSYIAFAIEDGHAGDVHSIAVGENGRHIWTGGAEKVVRCWDSTNGSAAGRVISAASTVCLDTRSTFLVAGGVDSICRVWNTTSMRLQHQLTGHTESVAAAYIGADAQRIFTASRDCTIRSWDLATGSLNHTSLCASSCYDLAVTVDKVCTAHFDRALRVWDLRTGKACADIKELHDKPITSVRVSSDGETCVTLSRDNSIKVVDFRMLRAVHTFVDQRLTITSNLAKMTLSPDGSYCAAGTSGGLLAVFNLRDRSQNKFLAKGHTESVVAACWCPDGRGVATVGQDKRVVLWR